MIYDCFQFFNELELLEIRLNELGNLVDRFVLVESRFTHSAQSKPLYYHENKSRFAEFNDRIVHVIVDDMPSSPDAWVRENHQRNCIIRGLSECRPNDTIFVSDVDEIPRAQFVAPVSSFQIFEQTLSYYYLNFANGPWYEGTRALSFADLQKLGSVQAVRASAHGNVVANGGWHFSYLGGIERIQQKILAFAHQELNQSRFLSAQHIQHAIHAGTDLYDRSNHQFSPVSLRTLPDYVILNRQRFRPLLWSQFNEDWYAEHQCQQLQDAYEFVKDLHGDVIEIGCWEGKSTSILANACYPRDLHAVDTWRGNVDENPDHFTVELARQRNVYAVFEKNIASLTLGNVKAYAMHSQEFFTHHQKNAIKFCHIDASHDYASVKREIQSALVRLVPGGVLCGDDIISAHRGRADLQGGVEQAVRELLPGFRTNGNFWFWQKPKSMETSMQLIHSSNPLNLAKEQPYYEYARQEVIDAILRQGITAQQIVELGCATGATGVKLKAALGAKHYSGIEFLPDAAARALAVLDTVHIADIQKTSPAELGFTNGEADLLLALDVLEHLYNPWDVLAQWAAVVKPGGHVVVSIPNVQNINIIEALVRGKWEYQSEGLLDATHIRFFTHESVVNLLTGAGLSVIRTDVVTPTNVDLTQLLDVGNSITVGQVSLSNLTRDQVVALCTFQFVVTAKKLV